MQKYQVILNNIEWDLDETYDGKQTLPTRVQVTVNAINFLAAIEHAMSDVSDDYGWCILGCTPLAKEASA